MSWLELILEPILNSIDFESLEFKTSFNHKNHFEQKLTFELTSWVCSKSDILLLQTNYCFKANQNFFNLIILIYSMYILNLMLIAHIFIYSSWSKADDEPKLSHELIPIPTYSSLSIWIKLNSSLKLIMMRVLSPDPDK